MTNETVRVGRGVRRPWMLVLALVALVVAGGFFSGQAMAFDGFPTPGGGGAPGEGLEPPPMAPNDKQECFDDFIANSARCKALHCWSFLFLLEGCDDSELANCMDKANQVFDACMGR